MWTGTVLCWVSLFGASYATDVRQLVGLQGCLYAIGGGKSPPYHSIIRR